MKTILAGVLALVVPSFVPASPAAAETVATVGGRTISRAELEKHVAAKLVEVERSRYEVLREGLDELVAQNLLAEEAKARGVSSEDLVKKEITDKTSEPTDAEVTAMYEAVKDQLEGASLDTVRERLVGYLREQGQEERRDEFLAELKKKYPTKTELRPPKTSVGTGPRAPRGGGAQAPVTIVEFSDYECPYCKRVEETVHKVMKEYGDKVRLYYRDYPLPFHANARPAAEAAHCANAQGKFWEYHDKLMASEKLDGATLKTLAQEVGLDRAKFDECVDKKQFESAVEQDFAAGESAGVNGTPAFFINGRLLDGARPFESFKEVIDEELAWAAQKK
jgi:protein-disulfide isomerase